MFLPQFFEAVLTTLQPNPVRQGIVLPQLLMLLSVAERTILPKRNFVLMPYELKRGPPIVAQEDVSKQPTTYIRRAKK
jgi:hypothetical protein